MASKNTVSLIGRLGNNPEIKTFENGGKIANFSLATSERWKDKNTGDKKEKTEWHKISANGKVVDVIEKYIKKGDQVGIEGKLTTRSWEKEGTTFYSTEIIVRELIMLGGGSKDQINQNSTPSQEDEDLPF